MGAVGGGIWHFSKGMYHSPRGLSSRFAGGLSVRARARRGCAGVSCRGVRVLLRVPPARRGPKRQPSVA
jgi:hypothetical protein